MVTVPVGVIFVPVELSDTVTVQVDELGWVTGLGLQLMVTVAPRLLTVRVEVPELLAWTESPP